MKRRWRAIAGARVYTLNRCGCGARPANSECASRCGCGGDLTGAGKKISGALATGRGHLTELSERRVLIEDIGKARGEGARLVATCEVVGISLRTCRRWTQGDELRPDGRPTAVHLAPAHRFSTDTWPHCPGLSGSLRVVSGQESVKYAPCRSRRH